MKDKPTYRSSAEDFEKYLKGEMPARDAHEFERATLEDRFEQEALEGWEAQDVNKSSEDLAAIRAALASKSDRAFPIWRIAAAIAILVVGTFATYQLLQDTAQPLALEEPVDQKNIERRLVPSQDSEQPVADKPEKPGISEEESTQLADPSKTENPIAEQVPAPKEEQQPTQVAPEEDIEIADESEVTEDLLAEAPSEAFGDEEVATEPLAESVAFEDQAVDEELQLVAVEEASSLRKKQLAAAESTNLRPVSGAQPIAPDSVLIQGVVFDPYNRVVSNVDVIVDGTGLRTKSDVEGKYELKVPENMSNRAIRYEHEGFIAAERSVEDSEEVNLQLLSTADDMADEIEAVAAPPAATGAVSRASSRTEAQPIDGYQTYLDQLSATIKEEYSDRDLAKGVVIVKATVEMDGTLSDLEIVAGLDEATDEVALRLVREGPKWQPAVDNGTPIESEVQVPIAFR